MLPLREREGKPNMVGSPGGWAVRHQRTRVPVQGRPLSLHWVRAGTEGDPPLILIHGMASAWRQWRTTMERLPQMPLAAVDLPGFGGSGLAPRRMRVQEFADALETWCRAEGWPQVAAIGHSFGGAVLTDWIIRYPERFTTVGLLAPGAIFHPWYTSGYALLRWPVIGPLLAPPLIWAVSTRTLGRRVFAHLVSDLNGVRQDEVSDLQWGCRHAREMLRALDYYRFPTLEQDLPGVRQPVFVGWGAADRVVPAEDARFFARLLPDCRATLWEGVGHLPFLEARAACDAWIAAVWAEHGRRAAVQ